MRNERGFSARYVKSSRLPIIASLSCDQAMLMRMIFMAATISISHV